MKEYENNLDTVDHLTINVTDIEKSIKWYQTSFCCEVLYQDPSYALLKFANIKLALVLPSQQPSHLAFVRKDAERYGELITQREGTKSTYLADPTGNVVELVKI